MWLLDERGLVNSLLETIGVGRVGFLSDQWLLLLSAMAVTVWKGLGYYMIIYLAALAHVPVNCTRPRPWTARVPCVAF